MPVARIDRLTPAQVKLIRQGQRAMVAAERAMLTKLVAASRRALARMQSSAPRRTALLAATAAASEELRHMVAGAVVNGRSAARKAASERLEAELAAATRELKVEAIQAPPVGHDEAATAHAASAADGYVAAWRAGVVLAITRWDGEGSIDKQMKDATAAQDHRLARIASTENSRAYNEAHDEGASWVAERYEQAKWLPHIVKRWDATLDRKTCAFCRSMHGAWAIIGMRFRGDVLPGEKHPFCRCTQSLIVPTPVTGFAVGYELAAA